MSCNKTMAKTEISCRYYGTRTWNWSIFPNLISQISFIPLNNRLGRTSFIMRGEDVQYAKRVRCCCLWTRTRSSMNDQSNPTTHNIVTWTLSQRFFVTAILNPGLFGNKYLYMGLVHRSYCCLDFTEIHMFKSTTLPHIRLLYLKVTDNTLRIHWNNESRVGLGWGWVEWVGVGLHTVSGYCVDGVMFKIWSSFCDERYNFICCESWSKVAPGGRSGNWWWERGV